MYGFFQLPFLHSATSLYLLTGLLGLIMFLDTLFQLFYRKHGQASVPSCTYKLVLWKVIGSVNTVLGYWVHRFTLYLGGVLLSWYEKIEWVSRGLYIVLYTF